MIPSHGPAVGIVLVLGISLLVGHATTQNHVNGYVGVTSSQVFFIQGSQVTTLTSGTSSHYGCVMGPTNQLLYLVSTGGMVLKVDPRTQAVVGTVITGLASPYDITVDGHGDAFVNSSTTLWKVPQAGGYSTVVTGLSGMTGGADVDIDSGDIILQSASAPDPALLVKRDGSTVTTLGTGADARYGIGQHIPTGDLYSGSCCGDFTPAENIFVLRAGSSAATVWLSSALPPVGVYSLKVDRASAATQRLILGAFRPSSTPRGPGGIYTVDLSTKTVNHLTTLNFSLYETEILYRRNVFGLNTGPGTWQIGVNIPEDKGLSYILGVGFSGVRPGLPLPDGRRIHLVPDDFTYVGLTIGLAPFLTGTSGTLNANGMAVALLDLRMLGKAVNGFRFHFLAVTLDPRAPLGIKTITDPLALVVEGL